jgi:hypothetical protein
VNRRDGSFHVVFPSFDAVAGLIAECTMPAGPPPTEVSLTQRGRVTQHLVKYSHHESGIVQFSQTGKIRSEVRRRGSPLAGFEGHLWTTQIQGVGSLRLSTRPRITPIDQRNQTITFDFQYPTNDAYKLTAFVYPGDRLGDRLGPDTRGPQVAAVSLDGTSRPAFLLAAPVGWKAEKRAIVLTCEAIPPLTSEPGSHLTFIGGFDGPSIVDDLSASTSFLALSYPCSDYDRFRRIIGTVDLSGG